MQEIAHGLWIGNSFEARDIRGLYEANLRAVVDLALEEKPISDFPREMLYQRIPLIDGEGNEPALLAFAVRTTAWLHENQQPVLVACSAGMSRSPAISAAALALRADEDPNEMLGQVTSTKPHDISPGLWHDVLLALESCEACRNR